MSSYREFATGVSTSGRYTPAQGDIVVMKYLAGLMVTAYRRGHPYRNMQQASIALAVSVLRLR